MHQHVKCLNVFNMDPLLCSTGMNRRVVKLKSTETQDCPICLHTMFGRTCVYNACGHAMHLSCEKKFFNSKCLTRDRCPVCRSPNTNTIEEKQKFSIISIDHEDNSYSLIIHVYNETFTFHITSDDQSSSSSL